MMFLPSVNLKDTECMPGVQYTILYLYVHECFIYESWGHLYVCWQAPYCFILSVGPRKGPHVSAQWYRNNTMLVLFLCSMLIVAKNWIKNGGDSKLLYSIMTT